MWQHIDSHFRQFLDELELLPTEREDAQGKAFRIAKALFTRYYSNTDPFDPNCYAIVGSYGKNCAARPRTDIDMIFVMPPVEFLRFNYVTWNKQSYFLQEIKDVLLETFPNTGIRGDGPVVKIPFSTYEVELVPSFRVDNGQFLNAHTKDGGRWALSNPSAELGHLNRVDAPLDGMARDLIKMLKAWKQTCNVEMRSVCLEIGAVVFIEQWPNRGNGIHYYDFMVRDFFQFLLQYVNGSAKPAGIDEWIPLGGCWESKAQTAYDRAVKACAHEQKDDSFSAFSAVWEWQKIFGDQFKHTNTASLLAGLL